MDNLTINKTKVLSVQLGKTLSFVKFVVEWGGMGLRGWGADLQIILAFLVS